MFTVSEYLSRIERANLDILENLKPVSKAITLWLGLEGLRLNEDGTMEWVSRKRKPAEQSMQMANALQQCCVQYPAQYQPYYYGGCAHGTFHTDQYINPYVVYIWDYGKENKHTFY